MDISVVVLTYNRQNDVVKLVESLRRFHGDNLEIIVTDDGSDPEPDVAGMCKHLWQEDDGCRAATARNRAMNHVTYDKILFLDDDVVPHPLNLQAHSLALELYDVSLGLLPQDRFSADADERTRFFIADAHLWRFAWTGNMAIRRSVFDKVGGFDERYNGGHGYEDIDFGHSASIEDARFCLNRLAFAVHKNPHQISEPNEATLRNKRKFEEKWGLVV